MMKTTFKIAWLELKTLFSSPIAWLLIIIFTIQHGLEFITLLKEAIVRQGEENLMIQSLTSYRAFVTERIFGISPLGEKGFLVSVIGRWYLYVPLMTMGLVSRELSSGNIKLLFSSPIKIREIVWGKFIGMMMYWTVLMLVLLVLVIVSSLFIVDLDIPFILSCLLGVYFIVALYSSIGLFVSCLTTYQIVAAINTFLVLAALDFFGGLWQGVPFLRDLTYFINTAAHTNNLLHGFLVSRDIIYFISLTVMFVFLSIMVLRNTIHFKPVAVKAGRYLFLIVAVLLIGYVASRPALTFYWDVTKQKNNTLTLASQMVLKQIKGPVQVTIFDNLFDNYKDIGKANHVNDNISKWEPYKRFLPGLEIDYVHFYDNVPAGYPGAPGLSIDSAAKNAAKDQHVDLKDYLTPSQIKKQIDLSPYKNKTVIRIKNKSKAVFVRRPPAGMEEFSEEYLLANLKKMLDGPDTIAFLAGNGERSIENDGEQDYTKRMFNHEGLRSLNDHGFEAFSHNPINPIPSKAAIVVIADPAAPYSEAALKNINDYISAGGNVLIAKGSNDASNLEALTIPMGVRFMPGTLIQPGKESSSTEINLNLIQSALEDTAHLEANYKTKLKYASAINYQQGGQQGGAFKIVPVLVTDSNSTWNKRLESTLDTGGLAFHPEQGDVRGKLAAAVALTRQINHKQQRIMIIGNAQILEFTGGHTFSQAVFRWFSNGKFPLTKLRIPPIESKIKLSYLQTDWLKYWLIILIPGLLILFGSIHILKRRSL